jgi:hypothetical protein
VRLARSDGSEAAMILWQKDSKFVVFHAFVAIPDSVSINVHPWFKLCAPSARSEAKIISSMEIATQERFIILS